MGSGNEISPKVAAIICGAVESADCWGAGRISTAKKAIEDEGIQWEHWMEDYVFIIGEEKDND